MSGENLLKIIMFTDIKTSHLIVKWKYKDCNIISKNLPRKSPHPLFKISYNENL